MERDREEIPIGSQNCGRDTDESRSSAIACAVQSVAPGPTHRHQCNRLHPGPPIGISAVDYTD
jgi:hypothetical protein